MRALAQPMNPSPQPKRRGHGEPEGHDGPPRMDRSELSSRSVQNGVALETALEAIGRVLAAYETLIATELVRSHPDLDAITAWSQARGSASTAYWQLGPGDLRRIGESILEHGST